MISRRAFFTAIAGAPLAAKAAMAAPIPIAETYAGSVVFFNHTMDEALGPAVEVISESECARRLAYFVARPWIMKNGRT